MDESNPSPRPATTPTSEFLLAEARRSLPTPRGWRTEQLLAIVVGGHPRSEIVDRPLADWLLRTIRERLAAVGDLGGRIPLVVTDLWFLNDRLLMQQPAIAIGEPGVNAASAHFAVRVPQLLVVDEALRIHLDPEHPKVRACLWGATPERTEQGVRLFAERHLDGFLAASLAASPQAA